MNLNGLSNLPTCRFTHNYNLYSVNYRKNELSFDCKVDRFSDFQGKTQES